MPNAKRKIVIRNFAGGQNLSKGEKNLKVNENVISRNMEYTEEGGCRTSKGYGDTGWNWGEANQGIDGLFVMPNYPDLIFGAVNGKLKYVDASVAPQANTSVYNVDTGLSLTAGARVMMKDYRGMLYYCNGVDDLARISVGQLESSLAAPPSDTTLNIRSATYAWTVCGLNANVFYLRLVGGTNPIVDDPVSVIANSLTLVRDDANFPNTMPVSTWSYGDADSLGYNTIYVRLADNADPDSKSDGFVVANYGAQMSLNDAEGYKFTNDTDKVYIEGDEIDVVGVRTLGVGDDLYGATNITSVHPAGSYVTQYNSLSSDERPPNGGSIRARAMAIWRDTMWLAGMPDEPNVLRYGKTISSVGSIVTGDIHDFSDGENYIIGDGGELTALHASEDRLYVFTKNKTYYIGIEIDSTGQEIFSPDRLFSPNYGYANPFCVTEMEDAVVFFTGDRLIKASFQPNSQRIQPDPRFDERIVSTFVDADVDQSAASVHYSPSDKKLYLTYKKAGVLQTLVLDNNLRIFAGPYDHDTNAYVQHEKNTYFGNRDDDIVYRFGTTLDADTITMIHRYLSGRMDDGNRNWKLFLKARVEGKIRAGTEIGHLIKIDDNSFGGTRPINVTTAKVFVPDEDEGIGVGGTGTSGIGQGIAPQEMRNFEYNYTIGQRGKDVRVDFFTNALSTQWEINYMEIEYIEMNTNPAQHR